MQERGFTEKDWKLFRNRIAGWQEAYMDRLNQEYIGLLSADASPAEKFWELEKRIKNDRRRAGVIVGMRRSKLIYNMVSLIREGAIQREDLDEFSDELKESMDFFFREIDDVDEIEELEDIEENKK